MLRERLEELLSVIPDTQIESAADVEAISKRLRDKRFDVIILDISMPAKTFANNECNTRDESNRWRRGLELIRWTKQRAPGAMVIILLDVDHPRYRTEIWRLGAAYAFDTPRELDQLTSVLSEIGRHPDTAVGI